MAIFYCQMSVVGRSGGASAVSKAAYRSGTRLHDRRNGQVLDYQARQGSVAAAFIEARADAPQWASNREELWNRVEQRETRVNSQLARELTIALPHELTLAQNRALVEDFARSLIDRYGVAVDCAIHYPSPEGDERNIHAHLMMTTRTLDARGLGEKIRVLDAFDTRRTELNAIRLAWQTHANEALLVAGHDVQIDARSYAARGITAEPTVHKGPAITAMLRRDDAIVAPPLAWTHAENLQTILDNPRDALAILTQERSVFTAADVANLARRYTSQDVPAFQAIEASVAALPEVVALAPEIRHGDQVIQHAAYTTRELLDAELTMRANITRLHHDTGHVITHKDAQRALEAFSRNGGVTLSPEQRAAVEHVTGAAGIAVVIGFAGAGKSTTLGAARAIWENGAERVLGAAVAGKAAAGLKESSGIESRTIAAWTQGWREGRDLLRAGDVMVVDEAGMVAPHDLATIVEAATKANAKLVLVGDPDQLQPIGGGAAFRAIAQQTGYVELSEIRRQTDEWARAASIAFARGQMTDALSAYEQRGHIHASATRETAREALTNDFVKKYDPARTSIALAYTRADVSALNVAIRAGLDARGLLGPAAFYKTDAGTRPFATGDRVIFLKNDRTGLKNGMTGVVTRAATGELSIQIDGGKAVTVHEKNYSQIAHGYAATVHKSQGATFDRAYVLATKNMDRHMAYVAMTRHRASADLYAGRDELRTTADIAAAFSRAPAQHTTLDYGAAARAYAENRALMDPQTFAARIKETAQHTAQWIAQQHARLNATWQRAKTAVAAILPQRQAPPERAPMFASQTHKDAPAPLRVPVPALSDQATAAIGQALAASAPAERIAAIQQLARNKELAPELARVAIALDQRFGERAFSTDKFERIPTNLLSRHVAPAERATLEKLRPSFEILQEARMVAKADLEATLTAARAGRNVAVPGHIATTPLEKDAHNRTIQTPEYIAARAALDRAAGAVYQTPAPAASKLEALAQQHHANHDGVRKHVLATAEKTAELRGSDKMLDRAGRAERHQAKAAIGALAVAARDLAHVYNAQKPRVEASLSQERERAATPIPRLSDRAQSRITELATLARKSPERVPAAMARIEEDKSLAAEIRSFRNAVRHRYSEALADRAKARQAAAELPREQRPAFAAALATEHRLNNAAKAARAHTPKQEQAQARTQTLEQSQGPQLTM